MPWEGCQSPRLRTRMSEASRRDLLYPTPTTFQSLIATAVQSAARGCSTLLQTRSHVSPSAYVPVWGGTVLPGMSSGNATVFSIMNMHGTNCIGRYLSEARQTRRA